MQPGCGNALLNGALGSAGRRQAAQRSNTNGLHSRLDSLRTDLVTGPRMQQVELFEEPHMVAKHDPGGKVRLALSVGVKGKGVFGGPRDCYRYRLSRTWDKKKPHAMFVMMNPSTADPLVDDPTVAKCGRFARAWGYGGIYVGNTFAYRATDKKHLRLVADPIGPDNDKHLVAMAKASHIVVFAYGQPGHRTLGPRGQLVARLLREKAGITPHHLEALKGGIPTHPYTSSNLLSR